MDRRALLSLLAVAALVLLALAGPSWAHNDAGSPPFSDSPEHTGIIADRALDPSSPGTTSERPATSWPTVPTGLVAVAALAALTARAAGSRRHRRAIGLVLVLLLTALAFEAGIHSVHHGANPRHIAACAAATVFGHLAATAVDCAPSADVILTTVALALEHDPSVAVARSTGPDLGRAPPFALILSSR